MYNPLYLSTILSILTEIFPNLGLSYFYPPNRSVSFYDKQEPLRWVVVFIVWVPIILTLFKISQLYTLFASFFIILSFYINKNSKYKKKFNESGILHLLGFLIIYCIIVQKENENPKKIIYLIYILALLFGGFLMGKGRRKNLFIDIMGRLLFSFGFYQFVNILINMQ
jgi:hypothetical protein|uniref:Uncharacterized protein n=1 Tax=viral metagenome TaxID=1070528 RepID=A0A6C0ISA9_9ZZZZ